MVFTKRVKHLSNYFITVLVTVVSALMPINTSSGATSTSTFQVIPITLNKVA
jgi:hypothetical protein